MKRIENMPAFLENATKTMVAIKEAFDNLPTLKLGEFSPRDTVLVNVDINNGFCKSGKMYSPRVEEIIPYAVYLNRLFKGFTKLFLLDKHKPNSIEFQTFKAIHCLEDSSESDLIPELVPFLKDHGIVIPKNSTNGFLSPDYTEWLNSNPYIMKIIIIGDVLDICAMQYAMTQKKYFDEHNIFSRVILVVKGTDTYHWDGNNHDADVMNLMALYSLMLNGVEIVEDIVEG